MGYRLPTFNLLCTITQPDFPGGTVPPTFPPRITGQACQLTYGRRVQVVSTGGTVNVGVLAMTMNLLLPPGIDIRGPQDTISHDVVEVPEGSGRWYFVAAVDDIGKGFANEHRTAAIFALAGQWTAPYP
jgi:hypothetical protein